MPDAQDALNMVEEICDLADDIELPDAAIDYAESVAEKARSIGESVEERGSCTEGQLEALDNMLVGLKRWFRD